MSSSHALDTLDTSHILFSVKRSWTSNTAMTTRDHINSFEERVNPLETRYHFWSKISQISSRYFKCGGGGCCINRQAICFSIETLTRKMPISYLQAHLFSVRQTSSTKSEREASKLMYMFWSGHFSHDRALVLAT